MSEHLNRSLESIERGLELEPVSSPELIEESAWNGLHESVEQGFITEEDAEHMFYEWFKKRFEEVV